MFFKNAEEVLFQWVSRVCSGSPDDIAALYHESAVLVPTFSPHTVVNTEGVRNYFGQLASRDGLGVRLHNKAVRKQSFSDTLHTLSGIYSFEFEVDQVLLSFPSRFSFMVDISLERPILTTTPHRYQETSLNLHFKHPRNNISGMCCSGGIRYYF